LEKTIFILELLLDPQLRRRQERGLNDMEAVNSASRAIFIGQRGEFRDRAYQDQVHRASCLHLLVAVIGAWTTPYLADAIDALRVEGEDVPDELIAHLSPIAWEPVNFLGQFTFDAGNARPLENRRLLRSGGDDVDEAASRGGPANNVGPLHARGLAREAKRDLHEPADKVIVRTAVLVEDSKIERTKPPELDVLRELEPRPSEVALDIHQEIELAAQERLTASIGLPISNVDQLR